MLFYSSTKKSIRFLRKKVFYLLSLFIIVIFGISCRSTKSSSAFFKTLPKDTVIQAIVNGRMEPLINMNDVLSITISSVNPLEDAIYNAAQQTGSISIAGASAAGGVYYIDKNGEIELHKVGKMKVVGLTLRQVSENLKIALLPYLKDPIVNTSFNNHRINLLGEIARPQIIQLPHEEKMSILEAISLGGDLTAIADKKNVLIIRDSANAKVVKHVNLEDHSIFTSPLYYLQANDIVYFTPDSKALSNANKNSMQPQQIVSLIVTVGSFLFLVLDRINR